MENDSKQSISRTTFITTAVVLCALLLAFVPAAHADDAESTLTSDFSANSYGIVQIEFSSSVDTTVDFSFEVGDGLYICDSVLLFNVTDGYKEVVASASSSTPVSEDADYYLTSLDLSYNIDADDEYVISLALASGDSTSDDYTFTATMTASDGSTETFTYSWSDGLNGEVYVYRLYNPNTGEHLYTTSITEIEKCVAVGWVDEDLAWIASTKGTEVIRLYNPNNGEHLYTTSATEVVKCVALGWVNEGVAFYTGDGSEVDELAIYRLFNPNETVGTHLYTLSETELDKCVEAGWVYEGVSMWARSNV